nr:MAG TPA: hypothetical protein [Caudoviricetes sp.]DAT56928.1 MAG TPA: hypothetical protein [Caudoviricetes sp.]
MENKTRFFPHKKTAHRAANTMSGEASNPRGDIQAVASKV